MLLPASRTIRIFAIASYGRMSRLSLYVARRSGSGNCVTRSFACAATCSRLRLTIVGDGPLLADLRVLADSLKITALTWFPGSLDVIPDVLQSLDVFVLPSPNEGSSNTILEAMASGLSIVATAVGRSLELVEDSVCGRFFSPRDTAVLSRLLLEYALDSSLRQAHGRAARQIAVARFSLTAMVARYEAMYDLVCQRKPLQS